MLHVELNDLGKFHKALLDLDGPRGLPYAARSSLNTSAYATRHEWKRQGEQTMVPGAPGKLRRTWTFNRRNHRVVQARLRRTIAQMEARAGNKLPYMAMQEKGFSKFRAKGLVIPEDEARITNQRHRTVRTAHFRKGGRIRLPRKRYRFRDSTMHRAGRSLWRKQRGVTTRALGKGYGGDKSRYVAAVLRQARAEGATHVFLDWGSGNKGIYTFGRNKLVKVWDMQRRHTFTRANPMLRRTLKKLEPAFPTYHRSALEHQIRFVLKKRGFRVRGPNVLAELSRFRAASGQPSGL